MKLNLLVRFMIGFFLLQSVLSSAEEARPLQADVVVEAQVQRLSEELRCLVCQNQTIADSHAELAVDLRNQVREMLLAGKSDQEVTDYMTARYGDFVRYRPPLKASTLLLWLGPFALMLAGAIGLVVMLRRREKMLADKPLTAVEARKVRELLDKDS